MYNASSANRIKFWSSRISTFESDAMPVETVVRTGGIAYVFRTVGLKRDSLNCRTQFLCHYPTFSRWSLSQDYCQFLAGVPPH
jgi:hypothetical protein